ncbi:MAG: T9SS type A sorting domain-containing protein [Flavobacteriales bacterium]|nr:T9SS type A sorting domain-containing protein [Flavobacteriales bacterium]
MKKKVLITITLIAFGCSSNAQDVAIPDVNFKAYLVGNAAINTNGDSEIQVSEANAFTGTINCPSLGITDLSGIEFFTSLSSLICTGNPLVTLDVSQNTALNYLVCQGVQISTLDLSQNTALLEVLCSNNSLSSIDVTQSPNLTKLWCADNLLSSLDVTQNTSLESLFCSTNVLTSLDVTQNSSLTDLSCYRNQLIALDVTQNSVLSVINCFENQLTSLDVSANAGLTTLYIRDNQITSIDLSTNIALEDIICVNNLLSSLDVSTCAVLTQIDCSNNELNVLNVANGNNNNMGWFEATSNPNLTCIQVDDEVYSTTNWNGVSGAIDATASFSEDCNGWAGIEESTSQRISFYPNPASSQITIDAKEQIESVMIFDLNGSLMQTVISETFSIENLSPGIYIANVKTIAGVSRVKFVKE